MSDAPQAVHALVSEIKRRWRRRALLRGAALSLLTLLSVTLVLVLLRVAGLPGTALTAGGVLGGLAVLAVAGWFVVRPGLRRISDRQVALFVEERVPELEDRLNSAVELGTAGDRAADHSALIDRLMDDAARQVTSIPTGALMDRWQVRRLFYGAAALLGVVLLVSYASLDALRTPAPGGALTRVALQPPSLTVTPGDKEIEQGATQEITVSVRETAGPDVMLHYRQDEGDWQKIALQKALGEDVYRHTLQRVQQPVQYFARRGDVRSETYALSLYEFPSVRRVDLTYTYPEYTGRPPRREDSTRAIRGLKGSTVTLDIQTSGAVERAEMIVEGDERVALEPAGDGRFRGRMTLREPGAYTLRLTDEAGKHNTFAQAYEITPLEDERPRLTITAPRRDVRPNAVEEVFVAAEARDDFGLKDVRLKYAVNGAEEQAVRLMEEGATRPSEVAGQHRFFLEELDLVPGDVISYYVEASDHAPGATPEATDMYFIEVRPFDLRFVQENNAGGQQGGGRRGGTVASQQQIITATWKLRRQQGELSEAAFEKSRQALTQTQANLKTNIEERLSNTAFSAELRTDEKSQKVVDLLRAATTHMEDALEDLKAGQLDEALGPERKALGELLKADALNEERKVAMQRQQSGGGGGSATEQRMTELMDLELDVSKDKYETQQQASAQPGGGAADEALQRVQELARKQEELMQQREETALRGEDKKRRIEHLQREQDQLKQQAENLARAMRQQSSRQQSSRQQPGRQQSSQGQQQAQQQQEQAQQRLQRASEQMRQAQQALRQGNEQQAQARQQQALRELGRLEEDLQRTQKGPLRQQLDDLAREAQQLSAQERQLRQSLEEAARAEGGQEAAARERTLEQLKAKRQEQIERLQQLKEGAQAAADDARQKEPELASATRETVERIEQENLEQQMQASQRALREGQLDRARQQGEATAAGAERVDEQMQQLKRRLPVTEEEQLAQSLQEVRALKKKLQDLQAQASSSQQQQQQGGRSSQSTDAVPPVQRQMEQAQEALRRMEQALGGNRQAQRQARELQKALRADHTGERIEGEGADTFFEDEVFERLSALEMELSRQLDRTVLEQKVYGPRQEDVPLAYRELVEQYYESLAESP